MYHEIDSAYSSAFKKIFRTLDKTTTQQCQYYYGALPVSYLIDLNKIKFLLKLHKCDSVALNVLYHTV